MPGNMVHFRDPKVFWRGLAARRSLHIILYNGIGCFGLNCIKRKWPWLFCNLRGRFDYRRQFYWWSSFAGNVFLVTGRFDCFVRFRGAGWMSTTGGEDLTQYLLITRHVWAIVNEDITKRSFRFLKISWHESLDSSWWRKPLGYSDVTCSSLTENKLWHHPILMRCMTSSVLRYSCASSCAWKRPIRCLPHYSIHRVQRRCFCRKNIKTRRKPLK